MYYRLYIFIFVVGAAIAYSACKKENKVPPPEVSLRTAPPGFPAIPFPEDNQFSMEKWELGKKLFYDKMLSVDYSASCASCHATSLAFTDGLPKSKGAGNVTARRNAPTLTNVAYQPYYMKEGGVPTLEMQVLVPIQEHDELNFDIVLIAERMRQIPEYVAMSKQIFNREPDPYVITRAIATFERTLVSGNSYYDQYLYRGRADRLTDAAKKGMQLFFSERAGCSSCHNGFNFTNYAFENNGLHEVYADNGRERFTRKPEDNGRFKVPTLRNIALTAPYMHDGSITTLTEVIAHYNSGGKAHANKSGNIRPLGLSETEQQYLHAFLESLTDIEFASNPLYNN